jgi:hypothetical protein
MVRYNLDYYNQPPVFADNNLLTYSTATPDVSYNAAIQHTHIVAQSLGMRDTGDQFRCLARIEHFA